MLGGVLLLWLALATAPLEERLATYAQRQLRLDYRVEIFQPLPARWDVSSARDWTRNDPNAQPPVASRSDFVVVRGDGVVLDEIAFAQHIGDQDLAAALLERREATFWDLGMKLAAAGVTAAVGGGVWYMIDDRPDDRAWATGLALTGAAVAVIALLAPTQPLAPALTETETQERIEVYNTRLRNELELTPADLVARSGPEAE
jgi:hypothetical protein